MNWDISKALRFGSFTLGATGVLALGATGVMLMATGAAAGQDDPTQDQQTATEQQAGQTGGQAMQQIAPFSETDLDKDDRAQLKELQATLGDLLAEVQWREADILARFDKDNDQALDQQEFQNLQNTLHQVLAKLESGQQGQQPSKGFEEQAQLEQEQEQFQQQQQAEPAQEGQQQSQSK